MAKASVKHTAFLDLEDGLTSQVLAVWDRYWKTLGNKIGDAAEDGRWDEARSLVASLDMGEVFGKRAKAYESVGMAAVLLGASRLGRIDRTSVYKAPPTEWLLAASEQAEELLVVNAGEALRRELRILVDNFEYARSDSNSATMADVTKAVSGRNKYVPVAVRNQRTLAAALVNAGGSRATSYIGLASNLHVSRLSSAGFLLEAAELGITMYQISEVLDGDTCPVCQRMHGQTFPVRNGIDHLANVFRARGKAALSAVSPWPSRSGTGLQNFLRLDNAGLMEARLHIPPYHPSCRGIVVPIGTIPVVQLDSAVESMLAGGIGADVLTNRMFGNLEDIESDETAMFEQGISTAALENEDFAPDGSAYWLGIALGMSVPPPED